MSWFETVILYVSVIEYVLFKNHLEKLIIFLPFSTWFWISWSPSAFPTLFQKKQSKCIIPVNCFIFPFLILF